MNKNNNKEYGCVCPNCNTVFIFNNKDITRPKMINSTKHDCYVECPNKLCKINLRLDAKFITEFTEKFTKDDFKKIKE